MRKWSAILIAAIMLVSAAFANALEVEYMHFTFNGRVYAPLEDSPNNAMDYSATSDYTFEVSCHFDTGGVDVGFAIDSSGSMGGTLTAVKATISSFAHGLADAGFDYRLGGCPFADSTRQMWDFDRTTPHPYYEMTDDITMFTDTLAGCGASGGGDTPEEYLDALAALMRFYDWRLLAIRILIGFTDADFCELGDPCFDCQSNENKDDIITELLDGNFILFNITRTSLYTGTCTPAAPYHHNWYQLSAETTGGSWYDLSTSWTIVFAEVIEFIRDYQSVSVALTNTETDTIWNVTGEFLGGPCFSLVSSPDPVTFIAPGQTKIFVWRFEPIESMGCAMDTIAELCFMTIFHSYNGVGLPNPDVVTGGCVYFGEDCGCNGTVSHMLFPPDYSITSCADQFVEYDFGARCQVEPSSFYFKMKRGAAGSWVGYPWTDDNVFINPDEDGFMWSPTIPLLMFSHGDTVTHELYILEDIAGLGLSDIPSGHFIVDLEGPIFDMPYPTPGALLGGPPSNVHIDIFDDIAGVDLANYWMSVGGDTIWAGDSYLSFDGVTLNLNVAGPYIALFPAGDTIEVCVGAQDDPDLCDPNVSSTCWDFVIDFLSFDLPERIAYPGVTVDLPVIAYQGYRFALDSFTVKVSYDPTVLVIQNVTGIGSAIGTSWLIDWDTTGGVVEINARGVTPLALGNDTLVMIKAIPHASASGGSFTILDFPTDGIVLNGGSIGYIIEDRGWVLVEWSPEMWTADLIFDSDVRPNITVLTLGMLPGGTDMYNPGLDIYQVPPPISQTDAYFPLDDPAYPMFSRLQKDVRAMAPLPVVWNVITVGEPGELRWDPTRLPRGIVTLNGIYEMHHHSSYRYLADEVLTIVYDRPSPTMTDMELCYGWNLIGFPSVPTVPVVPGIFPSAFTELYGFDPVSYSYYLTNSAEAGRGYWVWNTVADNYPVGGIPITNYTYPLSRGWNLVGCTNLASATYSGDVVSLQGWDCDLGNYVPATFIEAGHGYWALSMSGGSMSVPAASMSKASPPEWRMNLEFEGESYAFGVGDLRNSVGIPPVGPQGEFKLSGAIIFEEFDMKELFIPSVGYAGNADSWSFRANEDGALVWDAANCPDIEVSVNGRTIAVEGSGSVYLSRGDVATFGLRSAVPSKHALSIKPNPANAAFTVTVDLPDNEEIKVELFNMLGQRVDVIAEGEYSAGTHRFRWTSDDRPSGVYLVRVDWGGDNAVKRVVLMK
jgi:hypothetical protein